MRLPGIATVLAILLGGLAGCVSGSQDESSALVSFEAEFKDSDGWTLQVNLDPPVRFIGPDLEHREAYVLHLRFDGLPGVGSKDTTYLLDGAGRVAAVMDECVQPPCDIVYVSWQEAGAAAPFTLVRPGNSSAAWSAPRIAPQSDGDVEVRANGPPQWWLDFQGTLLPDDMAAPLQIVGRASLSAGFQVDMDLRRESIQEGAPLPRIPPWPNAPLPSDWTAPPAYPPSMDEDTFGHGFTARQAFDHLLNESGQARQRMDRGCLHQVSILPGPHSGGNVAGPVDWQTVYPQNDTRFNLVIADADGKGLRWVVEVKDEPLGRNISVDGPFENHFTTRCSLPRPSAAVSVQAFKHAVSELPLPSDVDTVAWRWDRHQTVPLVDEVRGLEKFTYVFQREPASGSPSIIIPAYITMRAGTGQWETLLVPTETLDALIENES